MRGFNKNLLAAVNGRVSINLLNEKFEIVKEKQRVIEISTFQKTFNVRMKGVDKAMFHRNVHEITVSSF